MAIKLTLVNQFDSTSPDAIVFDTITGNLLTADGVTIGGLDIDGITNTLTELTTDGTVVNSSSENDLNNTLVNALGLAQLPNGNFITSDVVAGRIVEIDRSGNIVAGGIDLQSPSLSFFTDGGQALAGLSYNTNADNIYGVDFFTGQILEVDTQLDGDGNLVIVSQLDLASILPNITGGGAGAAAGLTVDPVTGNFLVAEDLGAGNNQIHEITPSGQLVTSINLSDFGVDDPEGLTFDSTNRRLYVAFDDDGVAGNQVAVFDVSTPVATDSDFGGSNLTNTVIAEGETTQADSYLTNQDSNYQTTALLTVGDEIPLLEGEFPFLQTDASGVFPVDNLLQVDSGDNPLTASATQTFTLPGSFDGVSHTNIDGTNYVFVNHAIDNARTSDTNDGIINGGRISLLAFDQDWNVIGGRNLVERIRIANVEATNALRSTTDPATGSPFLGLVFGEYVLNPVTGDYEADLEAGVPDPDTGEGTFIVGNTTFLGLDSDVAGQTWLQRLQDTYPTTYNPLGNENFASLGSLSIAETGFRRRGGQAIPFLFNGDNVDNGLAYFHIANGTTVPIEGFGAFAKEEIISAIDFRQTADETGTPFGQTVLLSPEASNNDGELYMYVGDRVPGNAGGFADFEDVLYVLRVTDASGNVVADETGITEDTNLTAEWVLVDGNPLSAVDVVPDGRAINTLNADSLSNWVNGNDGGTLRSTNFAGFGGIVEDPNNTGTFYLTSATGLYTFTLAGDSPTGDGTFTLVETGDFDSVEIDGNGNVVVQDNAGNAFLYDVANDALTPFVQANQTAIDPNGTTPWETEGATEASSNFGGTGLSSYLTTVAANSIVNVSGGGFAEDGTSDEQFYQGNLGNGGQLLLSTPIIPQLNITLQDFFSFESGDGIAFNPTTGDFIVGQSVSTNAGNTAFDAEIVRVDTDGNVITTVPFPNSPSIDASGVSFLANGNFIVNSALGQSIQEFTIDGNQITQVADGINITNLPGLSDNILIASNFYDAASDTIFAADLLSPQIFQFDTNGNTLNTIDLSAIFPNGSAIQGLVIDSTTGNFIVADDSNFGSSSLYEITSSGQLVSSISLLDQFGPQFADAEGLTIDSTTNTLYVAVDDDNPDLPGDLIAAFDLSGTVIDPNNQPITPVGSLPGAFNFTQADSNLVVEFFSSSSTTVQEIGVFFLDADGTIGGVAPGSNDFTAAALGRTELLQSLIANPPSGFNQGGLARVLNNFGAGTQIAFVRVNDGTISEAIDGTATDIAFSTDDDVTITTTPVGDGFTLDFDNEFTVKVESIPSSDVSVPLGVGLQNNNRLAAIDLRTVGTASNFTATVNREAAFDNDLLFYAADDISGTVGGITPNTDGTYLNAVLANLVPGLDPFEVADGQTATFSGSLPAGAVVIPFIIANGTLADLQDGDTTNDPNVFFPFLGANSDGAEHVRILGDNGFGFEDLINGDDDYQDITVSIEFG